MTLSFFSVLCNSRLPSTGAASWTAPSYLGDARHWHSQIKATIVRRCFGADDVQLWGAAPAVVLACARSELDASKACRRNGMQLSFGGCRWSFLAVADASLGEESTHIDALLMSRVTFRWFLTCRQLCSRAPSSQGPSLV